MKCECETRGKLLATALELMWEHSYGSVSVDDICARADVRKGSFYHFFPSKSDLTVAAFEKSWDDTAAKLDQAFSPLLDPLERFSRFAKGLHQGQRDKKGKCGKVCGCPFVSVGLELSTQDEKIRKQVQSIFDRFCCYFESALRDAERLGLIPHQDNAAMARELHAFMIGLLVQARIYNDPEMLRNLEPNIYRMIGAAARTPELAHH